MKNQKILLITLVVIGCILAIFAFKYNNFSFTPGMAETDDSLSDLGDIEIKPNLPGQTLPLSNDPKDVSWAFFQEYLGYSKSLDLEGVKDMVYKVAPVCDDPKTTIDCKARMSLAYQYGSSLKKENFINVWSDKKQLILTTDFWTEEDDISSSRFRSIIFFIRDDSGNLKLLSFSPFKGVTASKSAAPKEEIDERLVIYTEDNDDDGIADYEEQCLSLSTSQTCIKTNPKLRDTDSDGLWDGIEALMK